jgi:Leucine-rich repeat (LRR) protein
MDHLKLLYLSYNLLTEIPANLPRNILELRFHGNRINTIQKEAFKGLRNLNVLGNRLDTTQRYTPTTASLELLALC